MSEQEEIRSIGELTDNHRELIRLLAEIAVQDYLKEIEAESVLGKDDDV